MSETTSSRRRFLRQSGIGAVATLCGGCKVFIGNRATDLRVAPQSGMVRVPLSDAKVLNEPGGQMVVAIAGEPTEVLIFKRPDQSLAALSVECPHFGCDVDYVLSQDAINCPCHGSRFSVTGELLEGPAEEGLKRYDIARVDDALLINLTR